MLIEFSVANYRSFREKKTLSLEAASIKELPQNTFDAGSYNLVRSAVIYGANSSGKSNLVRAMADMKSFILNCSKSNSTDKIDVTPFLLSDTETEPSHFELIFIIDDIRYRYGYEATQEKVTAEWLYTKEDTKTEKYLFVRQNDIINIAKSYKEGVGLETRTKHNTLFLSVVDTLNGSIAHQVVVYFSKLLIPSGIDHKGFSLITMGLCENGFAEKDINEFLSKFSLGFTRFDIEYGEEIQTMRELESRRKKITTTHNKYDAHGNIIGSMEFNMSKDESSGTNKLFDLSGCIASSLIVGYSIIIDELDAKLHPILTKKIISLYNNPKTNPNKAQLIFVTHDTNLLSNKIFRRDQIWFVEKDYKEASDLYSLVEFKTSRGGKVRNDSSYESDYIKGRYGAIPYINNHL